MRGVWNTTLLLGGIKVDKIMKTRLLNFNQLHDSARKCMHNVTKKDSVRRFILNEEICVLNMHEEIENGTWKHSVPKPVEIYYPKRRTALSTKYRDRVYQKCINDNGLYPEVSKHFVITNVASQKGKGTDFAISYVKRYLRSFISRYGVNGYVIQFDIHKYFNNIRHSDVDKCFKRYTDAETYERTIDVLTHQYSGSIGYKPGSQMVQVAGLTVMNDTDHMIKEKLYVKYYIRYNDDLLIFCPRYDLAVKWFKQISEQIHNLGLELNDKKCRIGKLQSGFRFLGFDYHISNSGKIYMTIDPENVKHERKKLRRMVHNVYKGNITKYKVYEQIRAWEAHARKGNTYHVIKRTRKYLEQLWESEKNVIYTSKSDTVTTGGQRVCKSFDTEIEPADYYSRFVDPVYCCTKRYRNSRRIKRRGDTSI